MVDGDGTLCVLAKLPDRVAQWRVDVKLLHAIFFAPIKMRRLPSVAIFNGKASAAAETLPVALRLPLRLGLRLQGRVQ